MRKIMLPYVVALAVLCALPLSSHAVEGGYSGGLYVKTDDGNFKLKTNIQLQSQYQFLSVESQSKTNTFQIRRGRLIFSGNAFNPDLTYKFNLEAVGGGATRTTEGAAQGGPTLRDAYINYAVTPGFQIQTGQGKPRFNREELTSSSKTRFVDRSLNNEAFSYNRDLGLTVHGVVADDALEYAVFAFNEGTNRNTINNNNEMLMGTRLIWNALGTYGYNSSDTGHSETAHLAFGLSGIYNVLGLAASQSKTYAGSFDMVFRWRGLSSHIEANYLKDKAAAKSIYGGLAEVGYFIVPKHFEVALRGAAVIPKGVGTNGYETGLALNYFFYGHRLKLQTDYNMLWNSPLVMGGANSATNFTTAGFAGSPFIAKQNDHRVRTQLQLYF